jgi:hypothetical protein
MSRLLYTVDNLVDEVRAQVDELNVDSVSTTNDILPSLNRGQSFAFDILARKYPEPILKDEPLILSSGVSAYAIPESVFEDRILKIEIQIGSGSTATYIPVERVSYRDLNQYSGSNTATPEVYAIVGRQIRFARAPNGSYNAVIWFLRDPEKLVQPQGRITICNLASNYVIVDSAGDSLTTESDQLGSYVNFVDGQTGEIKGTAQIQSISGNRVGFRTVPLRSSVLNREITAVTDLEVSQDDYLSPVDGTCVPYFGRPVSNFLIQFATAEITRKLGGSADMEEKVLDKFEKQVERTWAGREVTARVKRKNRIWGSSVRRWLPQGMR